MSNVSHTAGERIPTGSAIESSSWIGSPAGSTSGRKPGGVGTYLASLLLAKGHREKVLEVRRDEGTTLRCTLLPSGMIWGNGSDEVLAVVHASQAAQLAALLGERFQPG